MKAQVHIHKMASIALIAAFLAACNSPAASLPTPTEISVSTEFPSTATVELLEPSPEPTAAAPTPEPTAASPALTYDPAAGGLRYFNAERGAYEAVTPEVVIDPNDKFARFAPVYSPYHPSVEVSQNQDSRLALQRAAAWLSVYVQEQRLSKQALEWSDEATFLADMSAFAQDHPELQVVQRQDLNSGSVATVIYNHQTREIYWNVNAGGVLEPLGTARTRPGQELIKVGLPEGTTLDLRYNPMNGQWFAFAVDASGNAQFVFRPRAYAREDDATKDTWPAHWEPLFQGNFSERYPASFTDEFVYTDPESGLQIPIGIGLGDGFPFIEIDLTIFGAEYLAEQWLGECYIRYNREVMKNNETEVEKFALTMEEYLELVKQGKGQVPMWGYNEMTGAVDVVWIDPRDGVTSSVVARSDLPLVSTPPGFLYPQHYFLSFNARGQVVIVTELSLEVLQLNYKATVGVGNMTEGYYYAMIAIGGLAAGKFYWAMLTPASFERGGLMKETGHELLGDIWEAIVKKAGIKPNPKTDQSTIFASVTYR